MSTPARIDPVSPVRFEGDLDAPLSRWLWLVKWVLILPHVVVLVFLWLAVVVTTIVAWFAIVITGRYPRGIFDFNLGVFRWSWRVGFYTYSALGTDRYPPFTLAPVAEYPARIDIEYPERLSRGLPFVKWLLAIPHLIVVAIIVGGAGSAMSLVGILVLVAALSLLFRDRYPNDIFELVIGLNRWAARVGAYVLLMRDEYPPFRLDIGAHEPAAPSSTEA